MVEYLIQAPRIVKEQAPMNWMFLTCPQDGDVILVWQPTQMGTNAASDGYVWADVETAFRSEARGYVSNPRNPLPRPVLTDACHFSKWKCTCTEVDTAYPMRLSPHTVDVASDLHSCQTQIPVSHHLTLPSGSTTTAKRILKIDFPRIKFGFLTKSVIHLVNACNYNDTDS